MELDELSVEIVKALATSLVHEQLGVALRFYFPTAESVRWDHSYAVMEHKVVIA